MKIDTGGTAKGVQKVSTGEHFLPASERVGPFPGLGAPSPLGPSTRPLGAPAGGCPMSVPQVIDMFTPAPAAP
jgi:hypothetical protein